MMHQGRVISRTELVEHLYDQDFDRDSNTIEVFVGRLRKKIGPDRIETVRGLGYRLTPLAGRVRGGVTDRPGGEAAGDDPILGPLVRPAGPQPDPPTDLAGLGLDRRRPDADRLDADQPVPGNAPCAGWATCWARPSTRWCSPPTPTPDGVWRRRDPGRPDPARPVRQILGGGRAGRRRAVCASWPGRRRWPGESLACPADLPDRLRAAFGTTISLQRPRLPAAAVRQPLRVAASLKSLPGRERAAGLHGRPSTGPISTPTRASSPPSPGPPC